ncbi:RsmB/NOP family class I SAM-dependent RNA methyltransferase [Shewanella sp. A3A]|nr:RsmB/NOP family class I SAM-dependent RNA methyltransferase [Shewanella ferrihydritica]
MSRAILSAELTELIAAALEQVLVQQATLDRAYSKVFSGKRLAASDQAAVTTHVGALLRKLNLYAALAHVNLPIAAGQLNHVFAAYLQANQLKSSSIKPLTNQDAFAQRWSLLQDNGALLDGCPAWLDTLGQSQLADKWPAERAALAAEPTRFIRANWLKTDRERLAKRLEKEGVTTQTVRGVASALQVTNHSALFRTETYQAGWFEQQDAGSQLVADALDVQPGMRVIDACAGNGGKTLALAAHMRGKGRLLAMDVEQWKLDNLKKRAKRAGAHNIETRLIASSKTIKRIAMSADRLLLDVPCSGLGVLKRHPDTKWGDTAERLPVLAELQAHILTSYSRMLKVGGKMVYATCSIMPSENREQVDKFLAEKPQFKLLKDETLWPSQRGFDGFYYALLERIAE